MNLRTMWQLPRPSTDKPHGYKYSLIYVVEDTRLIGYDNVEIVHENRKYMYLIKKGKKDYDREKGKYIRYQNDSIGEREVI